MKKFYIKPTQTVVKLSLCRMISASGDTDSKPVYTDDPQPPGNALSREFLWEDEE